MIQSQRCIPSKIKLIYIITSFTYILAFKFFENVVLIDFGINMIVNEQRSRKRKIRVYIALARTCWIRVEYEPSTQLWQFIQNIVWSSNCELNVITYSSHRVINWYSCKVNLDSYYIANTRHRKVIKLLRYSCSRLMDIGMVSGSHGSIIDTESIRHQFILIFVSNVV